jgi:hypothetical protein
MPNLRIVWDNALERAVPFTASSRAGTLVEANLLNWKKSSIWRATGTSARITALFATPEPIQFVGFPFCNWSPTAATRVRVSQEVAATNLFRYSAAFDNALWVNTGTTYAANAVAGPDGTLTAERLIETATTADHMMTAPAVTVTAGVTYTWSIFVKADTRKRIRLMFPVAQFAANERATFDITSNTIPSSTGNGAPTITSGPDGWDRITLTGVCTTGGSAVLILYMMPDTGTTTTSYAGAITNSIYIWGAQLETGAAATSYYPTTSAAATRPAGYIDSWQSYDYDSGLVPACPWPAVKLRGFTPAQAASAYAYGGGTYARHWLPAELQARGIAVDIADPDNVQGYLEAACMLAGPYWSPKYNASAAALTMTDGSENIVIGGGDTCGEVGFISREIGVDLTHVEPGDRATLVDMARSSAVYPVLISARPDDPDPATERDHMAYAVRSKSSAISMKYAAAYTTSINFREV